ncbi:ATP-binding region ATPase domain protein [Segniliparus rotundus DSM 44985]|uniref:ATP-binding region ATPase domain protein n=1 Tax=Segniliparus rotundus (strain ATCC BAA-972 / CDC 1076 / CIP 108378 / DSM 44985 / JCM 13578) TaxID=640132 RepID=D6ZFE7_SEGRD|nr:HSP90 family protein [Segniliparus rotundus]ADG97671.1 ATP-binding region ATPase domain protein [Segniliparus rotundus DSM 44985]
MSDAFQVDLRGVVDLLSHHLYSSPRVYLREMLQNAVDAITARREHEPSAPAEVRIEADGAALTVADTGIGLRPEQAREFLATIGRSSKRDDFGFARHEFLGQFGVGLLSAFLVADEIEVVTKAQGCSPVRWVGRCEGAYSIGPAERDEVGTTVRLAARPGAQEWFDPRTVRDIVAHFGSMLPCPVTVNGERVAGDGLPWERDGRSTGRRAADLVGYAQDVLGFTPFDFVELDVPEAGLTGVAYIMGNTVNPARPGAHRVYVKRMLLSEEADGLLPDWAFFVRCVVNAQELRPTANREALYEDELLASVRETLGGRLRSWLIGLSATDPTRLGAFLQAHHLAVKSLAAHDDEMLRLIGKFWPVQTSHGPKTLAELAQREGTLGYTSRLDEFRQLAQVAAAQGMVLINAGYVYDTELVERYPRVDPAFSAQRIGPGDLATQLDELEPELARALQPFLTAAGQVLEPLGCEVVLRSFEPAGIAALYLLDRADAWQNDVKATKAQADELWAQLLSVFEKPAPARPRLVLNIRNPLVEQIVGLTGRPSLLRPVLEGVYGHALLLGQHPLKDADAALLNRSLLSLAELALAQGAADER